MNVEFSYGLRRELIAAEQRSKQKTLQFNLGTLI